MIRDPVRRNVLVYFEDGPLEGQVLPVDDRHIVNNLDMVYQAAPEQVPIGESLLSRHWVTYVFEERVQQITPYHSKRYLVAACGQRWTPQFTPERALPKLIRGALLEVEQPKGSRDFEAWWAMRMIEIGKPQCSYVAKMWESELRAYGHQDAA